jgi:hypothetical protein
LKYLSYNYVQYDGHPSVWNPDLLAIPFNNELMITCLSLAPAANSRRNRLKRERRGQSFSFRLVYITHTMALSNSITGSPVWIFFEKSKDNESQAFCKIGDCTAVVSRGIKGKTSSYSTKPLLNHIQRHHPAEWKKVQSAKIEKQKEKEKAASSPKPKAPAESSSSQKVCSTSIPINV